MKMNSEIINKIKESLNTNSIQEYKKLNPIFFVRSTQGSIKIVLDNGDKIMYFPKNGG